MMELYQILIIAAAVVMVVMYVYKKMTGVDLLHRFALTKPVVTA